MIRGAFERRLITREDDSALETLACLQWMIELTFWAAHPGGLNPLYKGRTIRSVTRLMDGLIGKVATSIDGRDWWLSRVPQAFDGLPHPCGFQGCGF